MSEHQPYHERSLEQQVLDTLLRIEAILRDRFTQDTPNVDYDVSDLVTNVTPTETPFVKAVKEKTRR